MSSFILYTVCIHICIGYLVLFYILEVLLKITCHVLVPMVNVLILHLLASLSLTPIHLEAKFHLHKYDWLL